MEKSKEQWKEIAAKTAVEAYKKHGHYAEFSEIIYQAIQKVHTQALQSVLEKVEKMKKEEYVEAFDNDGHRYQIPGNKQDEWFKFMEIHSDDEASRDVPDFADRIDGMPVKQTSGYNRALSDLTTAIKNEQ